jgi:hypothetical protein
MPLIRYTYPRDVRVHGDQPVHVEDVEARVLVADRRAALLTDDELAELHKPALVELADEAHVAVAPKDTKAKIVEKLKDSEG